MSSLDPSESDKLALVSAAATTNASQGSIHTSTTTSIATSDERSIGDVTVAAMPASSEMLIETSSEMFAEVLAETLLAATATSTSASPRPTSAPASGGERVVARPGSLRVDRGPSR